jgi:hypothetical protein
MKNSVVNIESVSNNSFGTGFVIDSDERGVFVLTCQHVLDDVVTPVVESVLAKVIAKSDFIDMAVLYVSKLHLEPLSLQVDECDSLGVEVIGFSHFNKSVNQKKHIDATLYKDPIELHANDDDLFYTVRKIKADDGFNFDRGNSGSPVICKSTGKVIAMISNKEGNDIGYAVDISNLKEIWKEMPSRLLRDEIVQVSGTKESPTPTKESIVSVKKEKSFFSKLLLLLLSSAVIFTGTYFGISYYESLNKEQERIAGDKRKQEIAKAQQKAEEAKAKRVEQERLARAEAAQREQESAEAQRKADEAKRVAQEKRERELAEAQRLEEEARAARLEQERREAAQQNSIKEDCVPFSSRLSIKEKNSKWFLIENDNHSMFAFDNQREAFNSMRIIKHYKMNQSCFVGRPNSSFSYMLSNNHAPTGHIIKEDCTKFNPNNISIQKTIANYTIVDGGHYIFNFDKKEEAETSLKIIKKYGFNRSCYIGRPYPSFTYLKKFK